MATWIRTVVAGLAAVLLSACTGAAGLPPLATRTAIPAPLPSDTPAAGAVVPEPATGEQATAAGPTSTQPVAALGVNGLRIVDHPVVADGATVDVEVLPGDQAWLIGIQSSSAEGLVGISRVTDPSGEIRYLADLRNEVLAVDDLHGRLIADAGAVGLYVASSPTSALLPGRWEVQVASNDDVTSARVANTPATAIGAPRLDVAVWVTADVAVDQIGPAWRDAMDAVLVPQGMAIGSITVISAGADGAQHRILGVDGLARDVHDACTAAATATGAGPDTAVVILAQQIGEGVLTARDGSQVAMAYRGPDGNIAGFAVSSPGTPVVGPASHACVAVSVGEDPTAVGTIALHEILHIAGLSDHTTERDGLEFDRLEDTPECRRGDADRNVDMVVSADECADRGADNIMFWAQGGHQLSPEQAWRVRWHPLLVRSDG